MYELRQVRKDHPGFSLRVEAFDFEPGKIYAITGPNGSGKTTLLDILGFLDRGFSGQLRFKHSNVDFSQEKELAGLRKKTAYLMQNPYLFDMSVEDNIAFGLRSRDLSESAVEKKTGQMLERFFLGPIAKKNVRALSQGQAQIVGLARTFVLDAEVYILDEPTANVDKENIKSVENMIFELHREKKATVILATHSLEQAYRLSRDIISIINGRLQGFIYENVFSGMLELEETGTKVVSVGNKLNVRLVQGARGPVTIAIDPQDIILSRGRLESSALNSFLGTITRVDGVNGSLRVFVDCGAVFCALITKSSFHNLQFNIGAKAWVTFKANSVKVV